MKYLLFVAISAAMLFYLWYQAKEDEKDKTVPVLWNNLAILASVSLYLLGCLFTWQAPDFTGYAGVVVFILVLCLTRVFGSGDAKALIAIAFTGAFAFPVTGFIFCPQANYLLPALTYIIASLLFAPANIIKGRKEGRPWKEVLFGKNRYAFFPYLLKGYAITCALLLAPPILRWVGYAIERCATGGSV